MKLLPAEIKQVYRNRGDRVLKLTEHDTGLRDLLEQRRYRSCWFFYQTEGYPCTTAYPCLFGHRLIYIQLFRMRVEFR